MVALLSMLLSIYGIYYSFKEEKEKEIANSLRSKNDPTDYHDGY